MAPQPADDLDVGLCYFTFALLPIAPHAAPLREIILDGAGRVYAEIDGDWDAPSRGVPRGRCRIHERALVGFVVNGAYRVGVVCAGPPDPESARRCDATRTDEAYIVGVVDPQNEYAHHHVPEGLLFAVHEVPDELRDALVARCERSRKGAATSVGSVGGNGEEPS